jgi:hypothetical protein
VVVEAHIGEIQLLEQRELVELVAAETEKLLVVGQVSLEPPIQVAVEAVQPTIILVELVVLEL